VACSVGIPNLKFFLSRNHSWRRGAAATIQQVAMAVATGVADVAALPLPRV